MAEGERVCKRCKVARPLSKFMLTHGLSKSNRRRVCLPCDNDRRKDSRHQNPTKERARVLRVYYKMTPEQFEERRNKQGGRCIGCGMTNPQTVDHDHRCCPGEKTCGNCVRGILCLKCNTTLGMAGDRPEVLENLAAYLRGTK